MHRVRTSLNGMVVLSLVFLAFGTQAQVDKEQPGPGLDPTPIVIPVIPSGAKRSITSLDLLQMRDIRGLSISPDGKRIAFTVSQAVLATNRYRTALFVVNTDEGSRPVSLGNVGPPFWTLLGQWFPEAPQWSSDSKYIMLRAKFNDTWQVWRWSVDGAAPTQITHCPYDVQKYRWSSDGEKLIYEVYLPPDPAVVQQLDEGGILLTEDIDTPWDIRVPVIEQRLQRMTKTQTWIRNVRTEEERAATNEESKKLGIYIGSYQEMENDDTGDGVWSPDHTKLALIGTSSCGIHSYCHPVMLKDKRDGPARILTPGVHWAGSPAWSADGSEVYFEWGDSNGHRWPAAVNITSDKVRKLFDAPESTAVDECSWDHIGRFGTCVLQTPTTPPAVILVDLKAERSRIIGDLNPEFKTFQLGRVVPITWPNSDQMHAHLILPPHYRAGKRYPLVITMYRDGDSFLRGAVGDEYPIQVFAGDDMAVVNFDVGALREFNGDFSAVISVWESPLEGLRYIIKKLDDEGIIDTKRIGITGLSHGAEMAAYEISHSDLFRAAAMSQGGSEDLSGAYMQNGHVAHQVYKRLGLLGTDGPIVERWHQLSASWHVDDIHCPVLLNESDREYVYFMEFYTTLADHHKPIETWIYSNEAHEKNQPKHRYNIYQRNLQWMSFWLQDQQAKDPVDSQQYDRWSKLRQLDEADRGHTFHAH